MTNVQISGLMAVHNARTSALSVSVNCIRTNELQTKPWLTEEKAGRCYTYRGVEYCYN